MITKSLIVIIVNCTVDTLFSLTQVLDVSEWVTTETIVLAFSLTSQTRLVTELALLLALRGGFEVLTLTTRGSTRKINVEDV